MKLDGDDRNKKKYSKKKTIELGIENTFAFILYGFLFGLGSYELMKYFKNQEITQQQREHRLQQIEEKAQRLLQDLRASDQDYELSENGELGE